MIDKGVYNVDVNLRERYIHLNSQNQEHIDHYLGHGLETHQIIIIILCILLLICLVVSALLAHRWIKTQVELKKKA